MRGTFANVRIKNLMIPPQADGSRIEGGFTLMQPSTALMSIYDAAMKYIEQGVPTIVFGGEEYGTGSSRDWAAKGTQLLGVKAVVARSFERDSSQQSGRHGGAAAAVRRQRQRADVEARRQRNVRHRGTGEGIRPQQDATLVIHRADGRRSKFRSSCVSIRSRSSITSTAVLPCCGNCWPRELRRWECARRPERRPAVLIQGTDAATLQLSGTWRLSFLDRIATQLSALKLPSKVVVDGSNIAEIDSAGALALLNYLETAGESRAQLVGFAQNELRIVEQCSSASTLHAPTEHRRPRLLEVIGRRTVEVAYGDCRRHQLSRPNVVGLVRSLLHPHTVRAELTAQFEQVCLNAIPVVALVTLLIGVVVAYLGLQAEQFGANIFVVDGVGIGATREFAPIIVAVIVAGRSGAAFTAQLDRCG